DPSEPVIDGIHVNMGFACGESAVEAVVYMDTQRADQVRELGHRVEEHFEAIPSGPWPSQLILDSEVFDLVHARWMMKAHCHIQEFVCIIGSAWDPVSVDGDAHHGE